MSRSLLWTVFDLGKRLYRVYKNISFYRVKAGVSKIRVGGELDYMENILWWWCWRDNCDCHSLLLGFFIYWSIIWDEWSNSVDLLQNKWTSTYDINSLLLSIIVLLKEPNPASPANPEAAKLYTDDKLEFYKRVKETIYNSWSDKFED